MQLEAALEALLDHAPDELETETRRTVHAASVVVDAHRVCEPALSVMTMGERAMLKRVCDQLVGDVPIFCAVAVEGGRSPPLRPAPAHSRRSCATVLPPST